MAKTKSEMLFVRVTAEEKEKIKKTAENHHRTMSDWCRLVILKKINEDAGK